MPLSVMVVAKAKGRDKAYKLTDAGGLYLFVTTHGGRYWRLNYRNDGRYKTLAPGVFPEVGLADARAKRDEARKLIATGQDPQAMQKRIALEARFASATTFKEVAEEWKLKVEREGRAAITLAKIDWLLDFAYPLFGNRPIADWRTAGGQRSGTIFVPKLLQPRQADVGEYSQRRASSARL